MNTVVIEGSGVGARIQHAMKEATHVVDVRMDFQEYEPAVIRKVAGEGYIGFAATASPIEAAHAVAALTAGGGGVLYVGGDDAQRLKVNFGIHEPQIQAWATQFIERLVERARPARILTDGSTGFSSALAQAAESAGIPVEVLTPA